MPRYECDCCGACCKGPLIVEAYALDVVREPKLATADIGTWYQGMTADEVMAELEQPGKCLLIAGSRPCQFLGADDRCGIYPTRPNVCVAMQAGDDECQMARRAVGLPPLEPIADQG